MSGNQQEPAGYFTHFNQSTGQEMELSRLRMNGYAPVITTTSYVNGFTEPVSGGQNGPNSSGTVSETKKMGKFKFLTIKDVTEGNSENFNSSESGNEQNSQRCSSAERSTSASPPRKPSFSSFINLPALRATPPPEGAFGIPGPLPLDAQAPVPSRRLTEEDYIQKRVQDLLKMTSTPADVEEEVESEEEDDFEQRLDQIMAEDVMIRRKGGRGRKKGSRGPVGRKRTASLRRGKKDEGLGGMGESVMGNGETVGPMVEQVVTVPPVAKKRGRKPKAKSVTTSSTDSPGSSAPPGKANDLGVPVYEDTVSHTSEGEPRDAEEAGDLHSPRKLKSRWAEAVCVDPGAAPVKVEPGSETKEGGTRSAAVPVRAVDFAAPGETAPSFEFLVDCVRLSRHEFREDREARKMRCECIYTDEDRQAGIRGCLEHCLNRMLYIECGPKCPAKEYCANKRFQRRDYAKLKVFKTEMKGWGIRTETSLPANTFICEYVGEILDERQFKKRQKEYHNDNIQHHYFMALNNEEVIDATKKGNYTRFTNHSCDPNSETQKWTVNGQLRIGFFTLRPVSAGEEITFDYQFERYGKKAQRCYCGSALCRGFIGSVGEEKRKLAKGEISDRKMVSEIDRFVQLGAIRTGDHALRLARLLLRVDEDNDRLTLLRVLQNSEKYPDALRAFMRCQGLTILADAMYSCRNSPAEVKVEILDTLPVLPIMAKNALIDSKIWETLERWAGRDVSVPKDPTAASMVQALSKDIPQRDVSHESTPTTKSEKEDGGKVKVEPVDKGKENVAEVKVEVKEEENEEEERPEKKAIVKSTPEEEGLVRKAAGELLDRWEGLKMLYKIPKKILTQEEHNAPPPTTEPAKRSAPSRFAPQTTVGSSIPTLTSWSSARHVSPSPTDLPNKRPKFFPPAQPFRRFEGMEPQRRFPFPMMDVERRRQWMGHVPPFPGVHGMRMGFVPPAVWSETPTSLPQVDEVELARVKAEEEAKKLALHQQIGQELSYRLQHSLVPASQRVNLALPDETYPDIRHFHATPEQAEAILSLLPLVGSEAWQEKANEMSSYLGTEVVPVEAPPVRLVAGWTSNFDLTQMTHLPKDWQPAYDRIGRLYFYNTITGVSRWEFPMENLTYSTSLHPLTTSLVLPSDLKDFNVLPEAAVDLNAWTRSIEAAEIEEPHPTGSILKPTASDRLSGKNKGRSAIKRRKIDFQNDVCQFILQILNNYRLPQCTLGRIESKEDFKFLARKFTHNVVEQEMQRHRNNPEALKLSGKHKPKIKEHIKKYMVRFGKVYRRSGQDAEKGGE